MPIGVVCGCGSSYRLKDEYAGQLLRCPTCGATLRVEEAGAAPAGDPAFARDRFLLRQKVIAITEKYYVHDDRGAALVYVRRPARVARNLFALLVGAAVFFLGFLLVGAVASGLPQGVGDVFSVFGFLLVVPAMLAAVIGVAPKRHITFYRDDTMAERLLEVLQDRKWQIPNATYTLRDPGGRVLARFRKNVFSNLLRKLWTCHDPDGREICRAKEDSILLSILRRFLGPLFGALRTNFILLRGEDVIGEFNRKFTLFDRYVLDLSGDPRRTVDRRIALAFGVLLDTGEKR